MALISNGSTIFDNGSMASGFGGNMVFIKKLTASSSATLSFVDGTDGVVLDDTYKEYVFKFYDIHPATDITQFSFNMSIDSGSNYNVTKTTTSFRAYHSEDDSETALSYFSSMDLAQGTGFQPLTYYSGDQNDGSSVGLLHLFNPSSTTFVKHFTCTTNEMSRGGESTSAGGNPPLIQNYFTAGYGNTVSAVNAIQFKMSSGNIDAGDICLYGIA